jgi:DNA-binding NarL/FixJ family response regulator
MSTTHTLLTVRGRYSQGLVTLQEAVPLEGTRDVLVTFLEDTDDLVVPDGQTRPVQPRHMQAREVQGPQVGQELQLTRRERDVLDLLQSGLTNREIAAELELSSGTIRNYTCSLYDKLKVRNRLEAVTRAAEMGLLG